MALDLSIPGVTAPTLAQTGMAKLPSIFEALKPGDDTDPAKASRKVATDLERIAKKAFEAHHWYYREGVEAQAHYHGKQWGYFSEQEGRYVPVPEARSRWAVRLTLNLVMPIVDQATAMLTTEEPLFIVGAATTEGSDAAAAQVAQDLTSYFWRQHRLANVYRASAKDAFVTGTSPVHVEWDTNAGRPVVVTVPREEPMLGPNGEMLGMQMVEKQEERREGDILFTLLDNSQVAFDPGARTETEGAYIFYRRDISISQLRDMNPEVAERIEAKNDPSSDGMPEMAESADRHTRYGSGGEVDKTEREVTTIYTLYLKTCSKYPRGKMVVFAQGEVIYEGDNPVYPTEDEPQELWPRIHWPILFVRCNERKTTPWGLGKVPGMMDAQKAVNGLYSKAVTHAAAIANTKLLVPAGYQVQITDELGQVLPIFRTQQVTPQYLNPPPMPDYVTLAESQVAKMEYIAGVNTSSMGQLPSSDTSGRSLQLLQQRDTGRLAPVKRSIDATWGELLSFGLRLFRRHADLPRVLMIVGENLATHVGEFSKASLAQATDVITVNDQSIPRDPMSKLLWFTQFAQTMNSVPNPEMQKFIMEAWRLKDFQHFLEKVDPHAVKAERNNLRIMRGDIPEFWEGDDHVVHKAALERLITSEEFERRVKEEQANPQFMGQSPTLYAAISLWQQHTQAILPQPGALPGAGAPPGQPQSPPPAGVATPQQSGSQEGSGVATPRMAA